MAFAGLGIVVVFFSLILSIFRSKYGGYPYRYFFILMVPWWQQDYLSFIIYILGMQRVSGPGKKIFRIRPQPRTKQKKCLLPGSKSSYCTCNAVLSCCCSRLFTELHSYAYTNCIKDLC